MESNKVSIVLPVYNTGKYLPQCLDSILNQTYQDFELICVNDGSTDNSAQIIEKYILNDDRIRLITQQNMYCGVARNNGLSIATGKYVIFLDSDDYFENRLLELSLAKAEETAADIVVFGGYEVNSYTGEIKQNKGFLDERIVSQYTVFS